MKRIIIGGFSLLGGLMLVLTIIIVGANYAPHISSWSGRSKLWYAIFGEKQFAGETVDSLFLGFPFIAGVILTVIGLVILGYEYFQSIRSEK